MCEYILKLSKIVTNHINFSLDTVELKIYRNTLHKSSYNKIKDIVSITEELDRVGIIHEVFEGYIQTRKMV